MCAAIVDAEVFCVFARFTVYIECYFVSVSGGSWVSLSGSSTSHFTSTLWEFQWLSVLAHTWCSQSFLSYVLIWGFEGGSRSKRYACSSIPLSLSPWHSKPFHHCFQGDPSISISFSLGYLGVYVLDKEYKAEVPRGTISAKKPNEGKSVNPEGGVSYYK